MPCEARPLLNHGKSHGPRGIRKVSSQNLPMGFAWEAVENQTAANVMPRPKFPSLADRKLPRWLLGLAGSCPLVRLLKFVLQISYVQAPLPVRFSKCHTVRSILAVESDSVAMLDLKPLGCVHPEIGTLTELLGQAVRGTLQHADLPRSTNPAVAPEILLQRANHAEATACKEGGSPDMNSHRSWSRFRGFGPGLVSSVMLIFLNPPSIIATSREELPYLSVAIAFKGSGVTGVESAS